MNAVTVDTKYLTNTTKSHGKYIGELMLQSLRTQRRDNIFCDVTIQCEDGQIIAHRCVLYVMSQYCKTLFTGSFPPIFQNGTYIMDLNSFSSDTIKVFIDIMYGEETSTVNVIDVGELLRLTDYLQVPVAITTEIFRDIVNIETCVILHELSLYYNCAPLQKILEVFICYHLKELVNSSYWKVSESALSSLQKNPLYLSQPVELIGASAKEMAHSMNMSYILVTYAKNSCLSAKSRVYSVKKELEMIVHKQGVGFDIDKDIFYFVYQYQLFCLVSASTKKLHYIYKYDNLVKEFDVVVELSASDTIRPDRQIVLPTFLPVLMVKTVIASPIDECVFIVFFVKGPGVWLMKLNLGKLEIQFVRKLESINIWSKIYCSIYCKSSMYFLNGSEYFKYNIDRRSLTKHKLQGFENKYIRYCEFQGTIYLFASSSTENIEVYCLNEKDGCLDLLSEHSIPQMSGRYILESRALSSQTEMILVLSLYPDEDNIEDKEENADDDDHDDSVRVICRYDPISRNLEVDEVDFHGGEYLFVPEHLFI